VQLNSFPIGQRYNVCIAGKRFLTPSLSKALGLKRFATARSIHDNIPKEHVISMSFFLQEDDKIIDLVKEHGPTKWSVIAKSLPGRIGKQCRERYPSNLVQNTCKVLSINSYKPSS
jgi:hypothetical protein